MKTKSNNTVEKKIDGLATQMETHEIIEGNIPVYWDASDYYVIFPFLYSGNKYSRTALSGYN